MVSNRKIRLGRAFAVAAVARLQQSGPRWREKLGLIPTIYPMHSGKSRWAGVGRRLSAFGYRLPVAGFEGVSQGKNRRFNYAPGRKEVGIEPGSFRRPSPRGAKEPSGIPIHDVKKPSQFRRNRTLEHYRNFIGKVNSFRRYFRDANDGGRSVPVATISG